MKRTMTLFFFACLFAIGAHAQTAPATTPAATPGAVSRVYYVETLPGKGNEHTIHLRTNQVPILEEQKKQGLIVSYGFFAKPATEGPGDWDLGLVVTYNNFAEALDPNPERAAKFNAITLKHYGTAEARTKANAAASTMRTVVRSYLVRGITFNPMPR